MDGLFVALSVFGIGVLIFELVVGGNAHDSDEGHHLHDGDHGHDVTATRGDASVPPPQGRSGSAIVKILAVLRGFMYASLGFGPGGLIARALGYDHLGALLWAVAAGALSFGLFSLFRRLQTKKLDSQIHDSQLLFEEAVVTVGIEAGQIGKVRFNNQGSLVERYAVAGPGVSIAAGRRVRVVETNDDMLTVEADDGQI